MAGDIITTLFMVHLASNSKKKILIYDHSSKATKIILNSSLKI